jgi:hypothetical protein
VDLNKKTKQNTAVCLPFPFLSLCHLAPRAQGWWYNYLMAVPFPSSALDWAVSEKQVHFLLEVLRIRDKTDELVNFGMAAKVTFYCCFLHLRFFSGPWSQNVPSFACNSLPVKSKRPPHNLGHLDTLFFKN